MSRFRRNQSNGPRVARHHRPGRDGRRPTPPRRIRRRLLSCARRPTRLTTARSSSAGSCSARIPTAMAAAGPWTTRAPTSIFRTGWSRADRDQRQQGRQRQSQQRRLSAHRRRALQVPVHHDDGSRRAVHGRHGSGAAARLSPQGRLPVGGRLLGRVRVEVWQSQISKSLPEYQSVDIPLAHPLFHMLYQVNAVPQIPSINSWFGLGGSTSERGAESAMPHARGHLRRARQPDGADHAQHRLRRRLRAGRREPRLLRGHSPASATRSASTRCSTR